jgi:adenylylsulfate reductase, subunit B
MYNFDINYGPKIDYRFCNGCGMCYQHCPMDVFGWDEEKKMPTVAYPAECAFCCQCEPMCPEIAIDVELPLHALVDFGITPASIGKYEKTPLT